MEKPGIKLHDLQGIWVTITPAYAKELLEASAKTTRMRPRPLRGRVVTSYAAAMLADLWNPNHQGIAIAPDGFVLDGQHRLHACVLADVPFRTLIYFNVPYEVNTTIDAGASRSGEDQLTFVGVRFPAGTAALMRAMITFSRPSWTSQLRMTAQIREILLEHWGPSIAFALTCSNAGGFPKRPLSAAMLAVIARAHLNEEDPVLLQRFVQAFRTNTPDPERESGAALALFKYVLVEAPTTRGAKGAMDCTLRTERAVVAFLRGQRLTVLRALCDNPWPIDRSIVAPLLIPTAIPKAARRLARRKKTDAVAPPLPGVQ